MVESIWLFIATIITFIFSIIITRYTRLIFASFRSREKKEGKEGVRRHYPKKKHSLGGGAAIFLSLLFGVLLVLFLRVIGLLSAIQLARVLVWLACGLSFAAIGFIDDWRKVNAAKGLGSWDKFAIQLVAAAIFTLLIIITRDRGGIAPGELMVFVPFIGWLETGYLFIPISMLLLIGFSNAVNLTDGLDALAGMSMAVSYSGYLLLVLILGISGIPVVIPLLVLAALSGFLYYNKPPASIIMGDTGALGLGAGLAALALLSRTEWLLLLLAAPFIINTVSVIIQMSVIKFFRKVVILLRHSTTEISRPFLCTPLHHHFQWLGWSAWPILALFCGFGFFSMMLALVAVHASLGMAAFSWFWLAGLLIQALFLLFASLQKLLRATYFLGLHRVAGVRELQLALYKGLPVEFFHNRWYQVEEITEISESMIQNIAAESILWRNISEIEARATLGKIYAEYKFFDLAAEEWEEIPTRNLLLRPNLVVQLGKIYYGRKESLRAIKLWEQLPKSQLAGVPKLQETIRSAKVRVGHLASRLYRQSIDLAAELEKADAVSVTGTRLQQLTSNLENALRYTQELRELLSYEQAAEQNIDSAEERKSVELFHRMDSTLSARRDQLLKALNWVQQRLLSDDQASAISANNLQQLAILLAMTPAEISGALGVTALLPVTALQQITKPSRNSIYRISLEANENKLPLSLIAKCFSEEKVTFFSACFRRERGVLQILQETGAPVPKIFGGHLGKHQAVLFMEDIGSNDMAAALLATSTNDYDARSKLLRKGVESLAFLRIHAYSVQQRIEAEINKIVKEVLTPEYYFNTTLIALNRILELERRQLNQQERYDLEEALEPVISRLFSAEKSFIHFEYTPGNLLMQNNRAVAMDFEQATIGPVAFDLATLLYCPEAELPEEYILELLNYYHELLPEELAVKLKITVPMLNAAAIIKMIFYAGSAVNFYRKFEDGERLSAMDWYLFSTDSLLERETEFNKLSRFLRIFRSRQTHLPV